MKQEHWTWAGTGLPARYCKGNNEVAGEDAFYGLGVSLSLDLNPIENLWRELKLQVYKQETEKLERFRAFLKRRVGQKPPWAVCKPSDQKTGVAKLILQEPQSSRVFCHSGQTMAFSWKPRPCLNYVDLSYSLCSHILAKCHQLLPKRVTVQSFITWH